MMQGMFKALGDAASASMRPGNKPLAIILPVHRNPKVVAAAEAALGTAAASIMLTDPLDYSSFTALCKVVDLILTDSGGVQEEAVSLGIPTVVLRNITERPEGILAGVLDLWPAVPHSVLEALAAVYNGSRPVGRVKAVQVYGNGTSAQQIVDVLAPKVLAGSVQPNPLAVLQMAQVKQEELAWQSSGAVGPRLLASSSPVPDSPAAPLNTSYEHLLSLPSVYEPADRNGSYALTVVVAFHKRPGVVKRLLNALVSSSHKPAAIWLTWFASPAASEIAAKVAEFQKENADLSIPLFTASGNMALGYWGRFQIGLQVRTPWVAFLDDDCIPGQHFLRNTFHIAMLGPYTGVFGVKGHRASPMTDWDAHGPVQRTTVLKEVDVVGGMWFMRSEHVRYMFWQGPQTWNTGEDITLCYNMRVYGGMRCYAMPANYSDPRSMGVSTDYMKLASAGDTTGTKQHPWEERQNQEAAYHDRGDYRAEPAAALAADKQCKLLVYSDRGQDLSPLARLVAGMQGSQLPNATGCPGVSIVYVASYAKGAVTGRQLAHRLGGVAGFVLRPGLTWRSSALTYSNAAKASDVMLHLTSIMGMVQPHAVIINATSWTAETLGVVSASHLAGLCTVGVVSGKPAATRQAARSHALYGLHQLVHVTPLLHRTNTSRLLRESLITCMSQHNAVLV
jgi:hypothetical protein